MKKLQAGIMVSLFVAWLLAILWLFGLCACSTEPDCSIVDCTKCWEVQWVLVAGEWHQIYASCESPPEQCVTVAWIYDPILNRWYYIVRDC